MGKYPNNCFASGLFLRHMDILPNEIYIGCNELFPKVSQFVASEYNIIDNNFEPNGKEDSAVLHHSPLFCSPYTFSVLFFKIFKILVK